jgi:hypothetical protein
MLSLAAAGLTEPAGATGRAAAATCAKREPLAVETCCAPMACAEALAVEAGFGEETAAGRDTEECPLPVAIRGLSPWVSVRLSATARPAPPVNAAPASAAPTPRPTAPNPSQE